MASETVDEKTLLVGDPAPGPSYSYSFPSRLPRFERNRMWDFKCQICTSILCVITHIIHPEIPQ